VFGIPETLYVDNGSDFTSHHIRQVTADLKISVVYSSPGEPRGRGKIERLFETVNRMFLSTLPGYIGPGGVAAGGLLDLQELHRRFHGFLDLYHGRIHSETGQAPRERWTAQAFIPQMADSLEQLDLLLLTVAKSRRVQRDGIRFQAMRYVDPVLAAYVGETVTIRYDPRDLGEIRLFHAGQFLCRAICPELAGESVSLRDIVRARSQRLRGLRQDLADRSRAVKTLMALRGGEPDIPEKEPEPPAKSAPRLKRYAND
jgi:putative transposase